MSVLIETSKGDLVVDLYYEECPKACFNFLSLCRIKYFYNCLFFNIQKGFMAQTGDPTNTGKGGSCIYELLQLRPPNNLIDHERIPKANRIYFDDEIHETIKHVKKGLLSMANLNEHKNTNASQFFITTAERHLDYLDGKHTIFGEVAEGLDTTLKKINNVFTDEEGVPLTHVRILKTIVLIDPFESNKEYEELHAQVRKLIPRSSPDPILDDEEEQMQNPSAVKISEEEEQEILKKKEAKSKAVVLEIIEDIPDADIKIPENVLFVRGLNPATPDHELEIVFSRFGKIKSCEIIKDKRTGNSLCYAFIEFETKEQCEEAYLRMENVVIDERRIHVDFSQSSAKLWRKHGRKPKQQHHHHHHQQQPNHSAAAASKHRSEASASSSHRHHSSRYDEKASSRRDERDDRDDRDSRDSRSKSDKKRRDRSRSRSSSRERSSKRRSRRSSYSSDSDRESRRRREKRRRRSHSRERTSRRHSESSSGR